MRQLYFIASGQIQYPQIGGATFHVWTGDDGKSVGVVHMNGDCDSERVIASLESMALEWLPSHHGSEWIKPEHAKHLEKHGVLPTDTTLQAMTKVHESTGFPPLKPRRF